MRSFLAFFFCLLPIAGYAVEATIRAGEHATFTRLVVDIPEGAIWEIHRDSVGYVAKVSGVTAFNSREVFTRVPATRITSLSVKDGTADLSIAMNCECHASAFLWRPDKLVIDINDGAATKDSPFEAFPLVEPSHSVLPIIVPSEANEMQIPLVIVAEAKKSSVSDDQTTLNELEKIVVESLARGATQGLLTPAKQLGLSDASVQQTQLGHISGHFEQNQPGLLAHTSIDLGEGVDGETQIQSDNSCLPESYFAIEGWGKVGDFTQTIGQLRMKLTNETDELSHDSINELAKAYIFYGFGREAIQTLVLDHENSQERNVIIAIGTIIDGDLLKDAEILKHQGTCNGASAFWAFLGSVTASKNSDNKDAILRAFRRLPVQLQSHLRTKLYERFTEIGDFEAAEMALSTEEYFPNPSVESAIAKAELKTEIGSLGEATEDLLKAIEDNSRITPQGLADYFRLAVRIGAPIDAETIALADILRFEYGEQEVAIELAEAQVEALLAVSNPKSALEVLEETHDMMGVDERNKLMTAAILQATEIYSDSAFLELAFSEELEIVAPQAENAIAKRLLDLNLPERTTVLLAKNVPGEAMMERRILRAVAALQNSDPNTAIRTLEGITSPEAMNIREKAKLMQDNSLESTSESAGDSWRMGNWVALSQSEDPLLKSVSRAMLDRQSTANSQIGSLATGRGLLENSLQTRLLLDDVLARYATISN